MLFAAAVDSISKTILWKATPEKVPETAFELLLPIAPLNKSIIPAFNVVGSALAAVRKAMFGTFPRQVVLDLVFKYPTVAASTQNVDAARRSREDMIRLIPGTCFECVASQRAEKEQEMRCELRAADSR